MNAPVTPEAMVQTALQLQDAGRVGEAASVYERLLGQWPELADGWYNLGVLYKQLRRYEPALACYQLALDRGIAEPEQVHLNRGVVYSDHLRQNDAARRELRAALAWNPLYVPALINLANLSEDLGQRDEAIALYERILALVPDSPDALARLANARGVAGPDDPLIGRLQAALARPGLAAAGQATLGFALGRALDAAQRYDEAFAAYALANEASRASAAPGTAVYDRRRHEEYVDQLIATFTRELPVAPLVRSAIQPIFICGMFRSGSTLIEQVLAGHPRVTPGGEIDFIPTAVAVDLAPFPATMRRYSAGRLQLLAARYLETLERLLPGAGLVTDKRPDNFLYIGLIKRLFPAAKIVHTIRDPLDNVLSLYFLHLDHSMPQALDLMDAAHYYRQYRRLMAHWQSLYGEDIIEVDYDRFVAAPRPAIERLLAACGLDWDEECLAFERRNNTVKTASVWQVREPLYQRSSGRSRHYDQYLGEVRAYLADTSPRDG